MTDLILSAWLFAPLFVGLAANGLCLKYGLLPALARPIDGGRTWHGAALFGASKTYRGIAAVAAGTSVAYALRAAVSNGNSVAPSLAAWPGAAAFGLVLGAAARASELVNSFLKRRLGIGPGEAATHGWRRLPLYVFDQLDFLLGGWLVAAFVVEATLSRLLWSALFVFVTHQAVSFAGAALGMRSSAR